MKLWSLAVAGLVVGLSLAGCGSARPTRQVTAGTAQIRAAGPRVGGAGDKFAGLVWTGAVRSLGADWRVPTIRPGSQLGRAATWIGAQGFAAGGAEPFIQIGTREELQPAGTAGGAGARGTLFYEAFWTDVVRGLHPVSLFAVHPGDSVAATMSLQGRDWTLTIADRTTGQRKRVSTGQDTSGRFRLALWLQEDPTRSANNHVFAYPDLSPVHVSAVSVNGHGPSAATLESTWMALPHAYLGPTTPKGDAFSVIPRTLSAAGAAYLRIAGPANTQVNRYLTQAASWRTQTPQAVIRTSTDRLITSLTANVARLRARRWPGDVAGLIRRLEDGYTTEITGLRRAVGAGPAALLAAFSHGTGEAAHATLADTIRRRLGVRQTTY